MLTIADVKLTEVILVPAGRKLSVALMFEGRVRGRPHHFGYSRPGADTDWLLTLMATTGLASVPGTVDCRLRLDGGSTVAIGHSSKDVWFDPRPDGQRGPAVSCSRSRVPCALAHINSRRARFGQRDLDPAASGWTDDDIIIEAQRLGWE